MTTIASPIPQALDRSLDQKRAALRKANQVRFARAALKRRLATKEIRPAQVLADPPACALGMRAFDVIRARGGWGVSKTRRLMVSARVSESKTVGGLSDRQRAELVQLLGGDR